MIIIRMCVPNIAIPENGNRKFILLDSSLSSERSVGLHPDMVGVKDLYDQGMVSFVQGVSYEHHNGSHFRSRDIMFMGAVQMIISAPVG